MNKRFRFARSFFNLAFLSSFYVFTVCAEIRLPEPKIEKLSNGLEVVWFESKRLPLIDIMLVTRAGYAQDPVGKSGTSELWLPH